MPVTSREARDHFEAFKLQQIVAMGAEKQHLALDFDQTLGRRDLCEYNDFD
jgi:hypothetical protein